MATETTAVWEKASAMVEHRLGLHFPPDRLADVTRGFADAAAELGLGSGYACAQHFVGGRLEATQLEIVASHLTIGETYFFRGDETFAAIRRDVLPALLNARRGQQQRLRVWSAGCCTGEEAYSLAILVRQLMPDLDDWHVTILATDLNPKFLRRAQDAIYSPWSFRGTHASFRDRYFTRTPDGRYSLSPEIRNMVTFAPLNLVDDAFPSLATGTNGVDLILCRNVLMYFADEQARRTGEKLQASLGQDGWLVVAPCEVSRGLFPELERVTREGAILYRRPQAGAGARCVVPPAAGSTDLPPPTRSHAVSRTASSARGARAVANSAGSGPLLRGSPGPRLAQRARQAADEGRLEDALVFCDRWVAEDKLDAEAHYLRAMVMLERGDAAQARKDLQRSSFLDPAAVMPIFAFGNLERSAGRHEAAMRSYRHVLELLATTRASDVIPWSEGARASQLAALVRRLMATEGAA